jgi:exodeoxyribonuclease VII large subunit
MAADQRAATPSAAAELLSPDQREQMERLAKLEAELVRLIRRKIADAQTRLDHLRARLKHPGAQLREQSQRLDDLEQRLILAQKNLLTRKKSELALLESRLQAHSPLPRIVQMRKELGNLQQRMEAAMQSKLQDSKSRLAHLAQMLDSLSPLSTLARGYAIVTDSNGKVLTDASEVEVGTQLETRLAKGRLGVTVDQIEAEE